MPTHEERVRRINHICYEGRNHFMHYVVLMHQKKKLLIGASFDIIYYYEFFILLTHVERDEESARLVEDKISFRSLRLESATLEDGRRRTKLITEWISPTLIHKGLSYYAPAKPIMNRSMDFTVIINGCFALEDTFKI
jgi:hypothetical protein